MPLLRSHHATRREHPSRRVLYGMAKNNRSKPACALDQRKRFNNQAVWPVILRLTGPICARAFKLQIPN
jgi:hypothetical protein